MKTSGASTLVLYSCIAVVFGEKWVWPDDNTRSAEDGAKINDEQDVASSVHNNDIIGDAEQSEKFPQPSSLIGGQGRYQLGSQGLFGNDGGNLGLGGSLASLFQGNKNVLVGPGGPTGVIGPAQNNRGILVGPAGPTGVIGPQKQTFFGPSNNGYRGQTSNSFNNNRPVLVGPGGPTGIVGPNYQSGFSANLIGFNGQDRPVLVGPNGPTGIIGPAGGNRQNKGLLVGPGGPTGLVGPPPRPLLVGPDGPSGIIGPATFSKGNGNGNGVLVGPGGPTGVVGPVRSRQYVRDVLVGPGGFTGILGPRYGLLRNGD